MSRFPFTLDRPGLFALACGLAVLTIGVGWLRRPALPRVTRAIAVIALALLALAAGGLTWHRPAESEAVVMVDLSASTRGAGYRDRGELDRRINRLVGSVPHRVLYFAEQATSAAPPGSPLADLPGERTVFAPPAGAAAVVLFSDGRFDAPAAAPPTFVVADPGLDPPDDAAVARLEIRGSEVAASVANSGAARRLTFVPTAATRPTVDVEAGALTVTRPVPSAAGAVTARLNPGDRWPENDALSLPVSPPARSQRWYVSDAAPPTGAGDWRVLAPGALPSDPTAYLAPAIVVLANVSAYDLSEAQQRLLEQYVRDLGGALILTGGDQAFARGLYAGTALESLSPLASSPPTPAVHWMLLADASGSMSRRAVDRATRWQLAAGAVTRLLPHLPPADAVSVGGFAGELNWWVFGKPAREVAVMPLPPSTVSPNGPTNLAAALARIAREADGALPGELLVMSDADVTLDDVDTLARDLKRKRIRLHVLAVGDGMGLEPLGRLVAATGGTLRRQLDPRRWADDVRQLLASAATGRGGDEPVTVTFVGDLAATPPRSLASWNRTWLKRLATELARARAGDETVPLAGRWNVGADGVVIACGFSPTAAELESMAARIARPPRDPRFTVRWDNGRELRVRVGAGRAGHYLNGLALKLKVSPADAQGDGATYEVPQTGPGEYELTLAAPRTASVATLSDGGRLLDRVAVAGRYAPEFNAVGNDHAGMRRLARRTGGAMIDPARSGPIDFNFDRRRVDLTRWLGLSGGVVLGLGLAFWRGR